MAQSYVELLSRQAQLTKQLIDVATELDDLAKKLEPLGKAVGLLMGPQVVSSIHRNTDSFSDEELLGGDGLPAALASALQPAASKEGRSRRGIGKEIEDRAVEVIKGAGHPLSTWELLQMIESFGDGFKVPGEKPQGNLAAHLSHSKRVRRDSKGWNIQPWEDI